MEMHPGFELLLIVVSASLLVESLLWLWAYRHPGFKSLRVQVSKQCRRLDTLKSSGQAHSKKNKKVDRLELHLREQVTRQLASLRLKQTVLMGAALFLMYRQLSSRYSGIVLARLPFEPPSLLKKLTQRGIQDPAPTDCGFVFLYAVMNIGVRPNIGKFLDLGPSRRMLNMAGLASPAAS